MLKKVTIMLFIALGFCFVLTAIPASAADSYTQKYTVQHEKNVIEVNLSQPGTIRWTFKSTTCRKSQMMTIRIEQGTPIIRSQTTPIASNRIPECGGTLEMYGDMFGRYSTIISKPADGYAVIGTVTVEVR